MTTHHRPVSVHSVDHFVLSVPDLGEAEHFYRSFGLDVRREGDWLGLYSWGNAHRWGRIYSNAQPRRLQYISLGVYQHDLAGFKARVYGAGLETEPHPMSNASGLWLRSPEGTPIQLVVAGKVSPSGKAPSTAALPPGPGKAAAPLRRAVPTVRPRHLSHILLFAQDVPAMTVFSQQVLGLRLSDSSGDVISFLHTPHGSDHHLLAFARGGGPGLHHTSWDVGSFEEVGTGAEQMRRLGFTHGWGVGRHALGSNYFYYVQDPWGSWAEYSFDMDFIPAGYTWPAVDHASEDALYLWGPDVPHDFVLNTELPQRVGNRP